MEPAPPTDAELRARVTHLEGLILAMDAAHEARDASPSEATDAACSAAYGALLYAAAQMRGHVVENVPIPGPEELYLNIHVRVDLSGGPGQVTARVAVDAQGSPVADAAVARELLHTVMPALRAHAAESATARAAREADAVSDPAPPADDAPSPLYAVAPETVRITFLWTGDPRELDRALMTLREGLIERADRGPRASRAERLARLDLARQLLDGALGEDRDEDETEPHEHLTVIRHERGGLPCPECGLAGEHKLRCGRRTDAGVALPATKGGPAR